MTAQPEIIKPHRRWRHWYRWAQLVVSIILLALDATSIRTNPYSTTNHIALLIASLLSMITLLYYIIGHGYFPHITKKLPWLWVGPILETLTLILLLIGWAMITASLASPEGACRAVLSPGNTGDDDDDDNEDLEDEITRRQLGGSANNAQQNGTGINRCALDASILVLSIGLWLSMIGSLWGAVTSARKAAKAGKENDQGLTPTGPDGRPRYQQVVSYEDEYGR